MRYLLVLLLVGLGAWTSPQPDSLACPDAVYVASARNYAALGECDRAAAFLALVQDSTLARPARFACP